MEQAIVAAKKEIDKFHYFFNRNSGELCDFVVSSIDEQFLFEKIINKKAKKSTKDCIAGARPQILSQYAEYTLKFLRKENGKNIHVLGVLLDILEDIAETEPLKIEYCTDALKDYVVQPFISEIKKKFSLIKIKDRKYLKLSSTFLLSYFLFQLHTEKETNEGLFKGYTKEIEFDLYKSWSKAIQFYYYKNGEKHGKEKSSVSFDEYKNALCFLISEYAAKVLKIERFFSIENYLKNYLKSQSILFVTKSSYRDHLFHMINICLLGFFLLNTKVGKGNMKRELREPISGVVELDRSFKNWFVSSLFHDLGYLLSLYKSISVYVEPIGSDGIKRFVENIDNTYKEAANKFVNSFKDILSKKNIDSNWVSSSCFSDHGVLSASYVINMINEAHSDNELRKNELIEYYSNAILAMSVHNISDLNVHASINQPIAVLLTLLDELQEWGRPHFDKDSLQKDIITALHSSDTPPLVTRFMLDCIYIGADDGFNPFLEGSVLSKEEKLSFLIDYSNVEDERFNSLIPWIKKSFKFQLLNLKDIVDIDVTFVTAIKGNIKAFEVLKNKQQKTQVLAL